MPPPPSLLSQETFPFRNPQASFFFFSSNAFLSPEFCVCKAAPLGTHILQKSHQSSSPMVKSVLASLSSPLGQGGEADPRGTPFPPPKRHFASCFPPSQSHVLGQTALKAPQFDPVHRLTKCLCSTWDEEDGGAGQLMAGDLLVPF
ncbi:hypothetical protein E2320_001020 [Naja naja]|nr:hypothetical protein E2320_001020 [Naja naja]